MAEEIIIEISKDGNTKITTKGFKGRSCKEATKELEKALGVVTSDTPTKEQYEQERMPARNRN